MPSHPTLPIITFGVLGARLVTRSLKLAAVILAAGAMWSAPFSASELRIGSVSSEVRSSDGGLLSADLIAKLVEIVLEGLKDQQQQQQQIRIIIQPGVGIVGVEGLEVFGGPIFTTPQVIDLGEGLWDLVVDSTLSAEALAQLQCPGGDCGDRLLLGTLLLEAPIDVTPEIRLANVNFLLAGRYDISCADGQNCFAASAPLPGARTRPDRVGGVYTACCSAQPSPSAITDFTSWPATCVSYPGIPGRRAERLAPLSGTGPGARGVQRPSVWTRAALRRRGPARASTVLTKETRWTT
jgi:hypothetical protein